MQVVSKNNYRETYFHQLLPGDAFVTRADISPSDELLIKTKGGFGICVQNGESVPFSSNEVVYEIEAIIVVNY